MALIVCLTVSAGYVYATGGTAGKIVDDAVITTEINGKIVKDPELQFFKINVDTKEGNVTLTGKVPNKKAEDRLIGLAKKVNDVKSVTSNLTIEDRKSKGGGY
jgi:hyperosmotically inducible protein